MCYIYIYIYIYITVVNFLGLANFYWKYGPSVIFPNVIQHFMSSIHGTERHLQITKRYMQLYYLES